MTKDQAQTILENALSKLLRYDFTDQSFPPGIGERPIMFRIAQYMVACGAERGGLNVDCDYNRHLNAVKTLIRPKEETVARDAHNDAVKPKRFFPDIVLHRRGVDADNLLVCEIKRADEPRGDNVDCARLRELTRSTGE